MNKKIIISLVIIFILIAGYFIFTKYFLINSSCVTDSDCVLSGNHPRSAAVCVNKNWQEEWDNNPYSENYLRDCIIGTACSGSEFVAGGMKRPENNCQCVNNHCQPADLTNYPGCQWLGC